MLQDAGHADVPRHPEHGRPRLQAGGRGQGRLRVAAQQRQPRGEQLVFELQPPAEDQVAGQQGPCLRQPVLRAARIAGLHALLGQVFQRGDGDLHGALALPELQGLAVMIVGLIGRAETAQHPAGEVHRAAREPRHLAALDFGRVAGEGVQSQGRAPGRGVRVPGEQQRVQGRRGMGHAFPRAGRRAQQSQCLLGLALVSPEHAQPRGGGHPVGSLGQGEGLAEQQLGLGQVTGGVPGPAADGQAAGPDGRIGRGQCAVRGELRGLGEAAVEVAGPRADLQGGGAGRPRRARRRPAPRRSGGGACGPGPVRASPRDPDAAAARRPAGPRPRHGRSARRPARRRSAASGRPAPGHRPAARGRRPWPGRRTAAGPVRGRPGGAAGRRGQRSRWPRIAATPSTAGRRLGTATIFGAVTRRATFAIRTAYGSPPTRIARKSSVGAPAARGGSANAASNARRRAAARSSMRASLTAKLRSA